jgi:hypothetical protein
MPVRTPLRIFHITAIPNLERIAKSEMLQANTILQKKKIQYANIAYQNAQGKRATKLVARPPGGVIHDYVPFYFAPRSPMLMAINGGRIEGCAYRQHDIVHLETTVEAIADAGLDFVFYDHNATLDFANCYKDLDSLDKIDWPLFYEPPQLDGYCAYWFSNVNNPRYIRRMETRQAEFLVHRTVPLDLVTCVGVYNQEKAAVVEEILESEDIDIPVMVKTAWYY